MRYLIAQIGLALLMGLVSVAFLTLAILTIDGYSLIMGWICTLVCGIQLGEIVYG